MKRTVIRCWLSDVPSITAHWIRCLYGINSGYEKCQNDRMLPFCFATIPTRPPMCMVDNST